MAVSNHRATYINGQLTCVGLGDNNFIHKSLYGIYLEYIKKISKNLAKIM